MRKQGQLGNTLQASVNTVVKARCGKSSKRGTRAKRNHTDEVRGEQEDVLLFILFLES
jgi:hypothetical protein